MSTWDEDSFRGDVGDAMLGAIVICPKVTPRYDEDDDDNDGPLPLPPPPLPPPLPFLLRPMPPPALDADFAGRWDLAGGRGGGR